MCDEHKVMVYYVRLSTVLVLLWLGGERCDLTKIYYYLCQEVDVNVHISMVIRPSAKQLEVCVAISPLLGETNEATSL